MATKRGPVLMLAFLVVLLSLSQFAAADNQEILNYGVQLDGTLSEIQYEAAKQPDSPRQIELKQRLLDKIRVDDENAPSTTTHPRYWILRALFGYWRHGERFQDDIDKKQALYLTISDEHRIKIKETTDYEDIYDQVKERHGINGEISRDIAKVAMEYYQITPKELARFILVQEYNEKWDNQERVNEALQHIYRDWSREGQHERTNASAAIIQVLERHFKDRSSTEGPARVLFPGSGLGRLPHDVASRGGFEVTANELSTYMRIAYRYLESLSTPLSASFHPFMDWWSYQPNRHEMIRPVAFPDTVVDKSVVLVEGDFTKEFVNSTTYFDSVVTFFFMDTSRNMLNYFETLDRILKPGGLWVNLGPLLYHDAFMEFSLDDMMNVAMGYGFEFIDVDEQWGPLTLDNQKARTMWMNYMVHEKSIRTNDYKAQFFAAVKKQ